MAVQEPSDDLFLGPDIREQTNAPRSRQPQHPDSSPCVKQDAIPCNFTYYRPLSDVLKKDYRWDSVDLGDGEDDCCDENVRGRVAEKRRRFQVCPESSGSKPETARASGHSATLATT